MKTDKKSEVTPNYTIDKFGKITVYPKPNKLTVEVILPKDK